MRLRQETLESSRQPSTSSHQTGWTGSPGERRGLHHLSRRDARNEMRRFLATNPCRLLAACMTLPMKPRSPAPLRRPHRVRATPGQRRGHIGEPGLNPAGSTIAEGPDAHGDCRRHWDGGGRTDHRPSRAVDGAVGGEELTLPRKLQPSRCGRTACRWPVAERRPTGRRPPAELQFAVAAQQQ